MAVIFIFCDQDELKDWIVDLCNSKDLGVLCLGREKKWEVVSPDDLVFSDFGHQFFLYPNQVSVPTGLSMNDVRPRDWGWITIRPGGVKEVENKTILLPSEIHGEKCDPETGNPEKWILWLKKKLKPGIYHGVRGRNLLTGGESEYKSIWYTEKAKSLFEAGVVWKQFPNDNSQFEPLHSM